MTNTIEPKCINTYIIHTYTTEAKGIDSVCFISVC